MGMRSGLSRMADSEIGWELPAEWQPAARKNRGIKRSLYGRKKNFMRQSYRFE